MLSAQRLTRPQLAARINIWWQAVQELELQARLDGQPVGTALAELERELHHLECALHERDLAAAERDQRILDTWEAEQWEAIRGAVYGDLGLPAAAVVKGEG